MQGHWTIRRVAVAAASLVALAALGGAGPPSPLDQTRGGLWEVSGVPGRAPIRQCIANVRVLAQFEHRGQVCPRTPVSRSKDSVTYHYNCQGGGFGQSRIQVMTPRSLRIETQGISGDLPFNYVIQARRVGNC
jgi:hypothetical protein